MKWRMRLVVGAIVTAIAGAAMAGWLVARTSSPPTGPVILISIESLRPDRLGAYGSRRAKTPNVDQLAAEGIVFERAYSHSPLTVPSHVSILSGRLPWEMGARDDEGYVLPDKVQLLPALLHRRGFKTAGIVSSALLGRETGLATAFDFYDDDVPSRTPATPAASARRDGAATLAVAERWVEQQGTRFFLFVHFDEVRPGDSLAPSDAADAAARGADALVGRFVQFLKARGLYDRAVIVVLSDHGEALGEHGELGHGVFLYDSTIRTPLIVKMPKQEGGGRRRSEVVQHADVAATILDLMGAPRPSGARGRSLRHLLTSDDATLAPAAVYAETNYPRIQFGWAALSSVTDGRYRFIRAPLPELYDLTQDRGERNNLAQANPEKLAELSRMLDTMSPATAQAEPPAVLNDEDREALLALVADARPAAPAAVAPRLASPAGTPPTATAQAEPDQPAAPVDPKDRLDLLEKLHAAEALVQERRLGEAVAVYRAIETSDPGVVAAWRASGALLLSLAQARDALDAYRHVLQLRPEDAGAVSGAARALARLGKLDEAARVAAFAARLDPVSGNELLVRLHLRRKDYAGADMAADAAKQADPGSPLPALVDGVELYQAGKYEEAVPRLEEAVQLTATGRVQMMDVRFYAGDALARLRRFSDAEALLSDELKWFPENVRAREALAAVYQATGRSADIPAFLLDLVRSSPTPEAYAAASRISAAAGDTQAATAFRAQSRQLFGENATRTAELPAR